MFELTSGLVLVLGILGSELSNLHLFSTPEGSLTVNL
jgi:hypothetical protein